MNLKTSRSRFWMNKIYSGYWDSLILKIQNRVNHSFSILEVINIWFTSIIEIGDLLNFHFFLDFRFCNNNEIRFYNNEFYKQILLWNFIPSIQWPRRYHIICHIIWPIYHMSIIIIYYESVFRTQNMVRLIGY